MRVIAGELKGRRLFAPSGRATRPTADRLREAIFNILSERVTGASVLDLFAGTGALGIEALSRGAHGVVFVDQQKSAIESIRRNIEVCGLVERTRVLSWDILKNLNCLRSTPRPFSIVFMDPPYGRDCVARSLDNLWRSGSLAPEARIVIEHTAQEAIPDAPLHFVLDDRRRYGNTLVSFMNCVI